MAKTLAMTFGIVFVLVGILGFFDNPLVGEGAIFHTDMMHNVAHLLLGAVLLFVAMTATEASSLWLKILGVVYLVLAGLGFYLVPMGGSLLGLIEANVADHWLHLVLGVALFFSGFAWNGDLPPKAPGTTSGS